MYVPPHMQTLLGLNNFCFFLLLAQPQSVLVTQDVLISGSSCYFKGSIVDIWAISSVLQVTGLL